jgi:integrase/recombinase XerD
MSTLALSRAGVGVADHRDADATDGGDVVWAYNLPVPAALGANVRRVAPISLNRGRTFPPEVLTAEEVRALMRAASPRSSSGIRGRAIIVVLWRAGLRVNEALQLYPRDVDFGSGAVNVRRGKGSRQRIVGLDPAALAVLQLWEARRRKLGLTGRDPLFATYSRGQSFGRPVKDTYVRQLLQKLATRAGIEKRVHPHGLRHTHAFELAQEGVPMHVIRRQLGHSNLATTARYIDHLCPTEVIDAMRGRGWEL